MGRLQLRRALAIALLLGGVAWPVAAQPAHGVRVNGVNVWSNVIFTGGGTVVVSTPILDASQTWNAAGVTFTGWKLNITDTASATASKLLDLQVGGTSLFSINKAGLLAIADGTSGAPSIAFASEPTLGFYRSGSGAIKSTGSIASTNSITTGTAAGGNGFAWPGGTFLAATNNGWLVPQISAGTIGSTLKVDALPTISSGCGTSPSVFAGSTPMAGGVNIGTGGVATTCVIAFNGTAFPSAPFCVANNVTSNTVTRILSSTTTLTLNTTTAWSSGEIVAYLCIGAK